MHFFINSDEYLYVIALLCPIFEYFVIYISLTLKSV